MSRQLFFTMQYPCTIGVQCPNRMAVPSVRDGLGNESYTPLEQAISLAKTGVGVPSTVVELNPVYNSGEVKASLQRKGQTATGQRFGRFMKHM